MNRTEKLILSLVSFIVGVAVMFFATFVTMKTWNWFMPDLLGLPVLQFWGAFALRLVVTTFTVGIVLSTCLPRGSDDGDEFASLGRSAASAVIHAVLLFIGWLIV